MDTRRWLYLLTAVLVISLLIRAQFLTALATALMVVIGLAAWWSTKVLNEITYRRRLKYTRGYPGETVPLQIIVENRKLLPVSWLRAVDPWPKAVAPENEDELAPSHVLNRGFLVNLYSLRWYERARRNYNLLFRKRGIYMVGPVQLESGDLFGMNQETRCESKGDRLVVFPAQVPLEEFKLPAENPFGDWHSRRRLFEDPNRPMGIREYHPEDSFRRIHWPATARTGELQVKVYTPTSAPVMLLCLNVSTFVRYWEGIYPDLLEQLVSTAATFASQGVEKGYRVGLISNGCLTNSDQPFRIAPGASTPHFANILEALAGVTSITTTPFERYLIREMPRVPYGATLVVITAITTPILAETLLGLKRHERQITLVSLAVEPPPQIPGIQSIHLPFEPDETLVKD